MLTPKFIVLEVSILALLNPKAIHKSYLVKSNICRRHFPSYVRLSVKIPNIWPYVIICITDSDKHVSLHLESALYITGVCFISCLYMFYINSQRSPIRSIWKTYVCVPRYIYFWHSKRNALYVQHNSAFVNTDIFICPSPVGGKKIMSIFAQSAFLFCHTHYFMKYESKCSVSLQFPFTTNTRVLHSMGFR